MWVNVWSLLVTFSGHLQIRLNHNEYILLWNKWNTQFMQSRNLILRHKCWSDFSLYCIGVLEGWFRTIQILVIFMVFCWKMNFHSVVQANMKWRFVSHSSQNTTMLYAIYPLVVLREMSFGNEIDTKMVHEAEGLSALTIRHMTIFKSIPHKKGLNYSSWLHCFILPSHST